MQVSTFELQLSTTKQVLKVNFQNGALEAGIS